MKNTSKKVISVCLLAAIALSAFGCGKKGNTSDMPVETISLEQTKQDLTFDYSKKGPKTDAVETSENGEDATEGTTAETSGEDTTAAQKQYEEVTQAMNVTDAEGHGVTDAAGQSVTEWVVVETREIQNQGGQDPVQPAATDAPAQTPATEAPAAYEPSYDTCKAYWLDMTQQGDYNFNGEFLTITFEVNQDVPDGNYPVTIATTDIASWDLVKYTPVCINGEVAVNSTAAAQDEMSSDDFCLKVNSETAKQGETVTMTIDLANNPGFCGFVIDIQYDSNALSIIEASGGKDFDAAVHMIDKKSE